MYYLLLVIHIIISLALVLIILAQSSKGGGLSGMMGGASNMLGGKGASDFMKKWTKILATTFFISCLVMAIAVKRIQAAGPAKSKALKELKKERQNSDEVIPTELPEKSKIPAETSDESVQTPTK
ncbi:MAG: preprotein translocase subunit SecG [Candidatus Cloacimonadota bacterium]|nr:preprotein translocase subunit SecG [Candidatus Cloacimonadota bacterium]